jgi:2-methylisocitrate lyase-like PEP mutase family enzyme
VTQCELALRLQQLHQGPAPLLLPNVWDVAGARVLEDIGYPAVATSSAAIANSLGYPDGERISKHEMLDAVERIAAAVGIPVTADLEAGYSATPEAMLQTGRELIATGAVGCNLEDSERELRLLPLELQVEKIAALHAAGEEAGVALVINARTDAMFLKAPPSFAPFAEAARRARAYRAAGAGCVFTPGVRELGLIARLLEASPGPLNILGGPGLPPIAELARAGVRRISLGSGPYRAAIATLRRIAEAMRGGGGFELLAGAVSYADLNALLAPPAGRR